jgi:hypothetical protein
MVRRSPNLGGIVARVWFPVALVLLLFLAIPGLILFAMSLLGQAGAVNEWLQDRFHLTYDFPLAWWLALLLLLVPLAIILLYFLKLKRKPLSVPSTFLWRKSIEDLHVNALFQWLRQNLLLLLQLLIVLALIYALMDFRLHARPSTGMHYILMIDNSASMAATDIAPNRLAWAKAEALKQIDAAGDNDFGMVIVFNSSAEILQSYTNKKGPIRQAVESIEQTQRPTRIEEALSLADSLANPTRSADDSSVQPGAIEPGKERTLVQAEGIPTEVHLYSDGRFADLPDFALGNLNIQLHAAGKLDREPVTPELLRAAKVPADARVSAGPVLVDNVALVSFSASRDETDATKLQVFARLLNFRSTAVHARVQLDVQVNGQLKGVYEQVVDLPSRDLRVEKVVDAEPAPPAGKTEKKVQPEEYVLQTAASERSAIFDLKDLDDRANTVLHARLLDVVDSFPLDDEAWLVVGVVRKARILLVGPPNEPLNAFFDDAATQAVATVTHLSTDDLKHEVYRTAARNGDYDLVIFDRCGPVTNDDRPTEEDMPRSNTFFIGYPPPPLRLGDLEKIPNPQIRGWLARQPLLRFLVALHEVGVAEAFHVKDVPERNRLIEIDQKRAILFLQNRQSFIDLVMAFPIINEKGEWNTNWPLLPSFPLFLRNVVYTLGNISDGAGEETVQPGQVKTLRPDVAVDQVQITDPAGHTRTLERGSRADFSYGATDRVGVYRAVSGAWQRSFAVNLLDAQESNIEPRPGVHIGAERVVLGQEIHPLEQPRELWKFLVLLALGLLLAEWYIYNRRVYV